MFIYLLIGNCLFTQFFFLIFFYVLCLFDLFGNTS